MVEARSFGRTSTSLHGRKFGLSSSIAAQQDQHFYLGCPTDLPLQILHPDGCLGKLGYRLEMTVGHSMFTEGKSGSRAGSTTISYFL